MKQTTLGKACVLKSGKFVSAAEIQEQFAEGLYPCYGGNGVRGYVSEYSHEGDYPLIGRQGALCGNVNYATGKFRATEHAVVVQPVEEINTRWLFYKLIAMDLGQYATGAAQPGLAVSKLEQLSICIPSVSEQERTAKVFDSIENLIALRKEQLAKLDELVKARFVEMFGDAVSNEKGWPLATLAEIAEIKIGPFGSLLHKEDYKTGGHALINPSHIIGGRIVIDDNLTIDDAKYAELSAYHLYPGDIVMGRRGEMGRCAVVYQNGLLCGTGSLIIRPNERMKPYFLQSILSSPTYKKVIEDKAVGVTMMNLNVPIVSELTVPLLPVDLQERFVEFMSKIDETKLTIQSSLDKLVVMQKALMQEYFG